MVIVGIIHDISKLRPELAARDFAQSRHYPGTGMDAAQVMPNHIHGIVIIGADRGGSLSDVMERFKSLTTTRYIASARHAGWGPFPGRLWQRNYHDRIIRNEQELNRIREYIRDNPADWESDENHPEMQESQPMRTG